jgi:hypothetical protein
MDKKNYSKPTLIRKLVKLGVEIDEKFTKDELIELLKMKEYELFRRSKKKQ